MIRHLKLRLLIAATVFTLFLLLVDLPAVRASVTSSVVGGTLTVSSDADDPITITCDGGGNVQVNAGQSNPPGGPFACNSIGGIVATGGPGPNLINLTGVTSATYSALQSVVVDGAAGNDIIRTTFRGDSIVGGEGNDDIEAFGESDTILAGDGDDTMLGGSGADVIFAGAGNDHVRDDADAQNDAISGGEGNDSIEGGGGFANDRIVEIANVPLLTLGSTQMVGLGTDTITGIEEASLTGGAGANAIDAGGFTGKTTID
ncbi:MAG: calcium-binding protein, partial [Actinomycetota bacterium]